MSSETKFISEKKYHDMNSDGKDRISNVTSDSQTFRLSDSSDDSKQIENQTFFQNYSDYKHLFQPKVKQSQFTTSLQKKSINWLITFCWTRNYSEQILWYSICYFYSYTCFHVVKKDRLTLILISAVNLALKLFESDQEMGLDMMKQSLNAGFQREDFRKVEEEFVKIFDFDLFFPTLLSQIFRLNKSEEEISKILYLSEILFFNNYQPALNDILLEDILLLVQEPETCNHLKSEIMKLSKNSKYLDILKQKFSSKFNTDEFMNKILNQY